VPQEPTYEELSCRVKDLELETAGFKQALQESERKYGDLVQNANSIILRMDMAGNVRFFNGFAQKFFGYAEEEVIGRNVLGTIVPETESVRRDLAAMIQGIGLNPELFATSENENIRRDGERVWIAWANKAICDADGNTIEILCIGNDITRQKRLEEQLRQAQKMESIGTLAGGIAHDFNNILGIILGNTELAMDYVLEAAPARQNIEEIQRACLRGRDVVRQILAFSRQREQELQPVRIEQVVEEFLHLLRSSIPTTIEIRKRFSKISGIVLADPTQIKQVLLNLCINAAHAMREKGAFLRLACNVLN